MAQLTVVTLRRWPYCPNKNDFMRPPKLSIRQSRLPQIRWQTVPQPRCRVSKCSVAEGALRATDGQCSSVGRTQSSGSGIGDEPAIISQVSRNVPRQRPVNKGDDLKVDALPHRKPVKLTKHWCDVVTSSRAGDQPGSSILYKLQASHQLVGYAVEERVT